MKQIIFAILLIFLVGCANTMVKNDQTKESTIVEPAAPVVIKEPQQKKLSLYDVQQIVCAFVKTCAFTERVTAGKAAELPEGQDLKYYETVGGPFLIMEGNIGNFSAFVNNQAKLRFEKLKKSIKPTDFRIQTFYSVEEYKKAYLYKYKVWEYTSPSGRDNDKNFLQPIYGSRFFVKCSDYVIEVFPDFFGGKNEGWEGLNEIDYDATIENEIQFQINNMKPKVDGLLGLCN